MSKTNAIRLLESLKIPHQIFDYESTENELDAVSVAHKINADPETVFKTLVTSGDTNKIYVFVIPGPFDLDLKKAAKASSNKKIEMIKMKELLPLTGYIRGGCSPIGMKKLFSTLIDESAQLFDQIFVSAGIRGQQIKISPEDLLEVVNAKFSELI